MRRYVLLSYCMAMRTVSFRVKKRFPDLQHLVDAGLMREDELKVSSPSSLLPRARIFKRLWSPGIDSKALFSASLCSLAGRYDYPIPTRCLAPIDFLKIPAQCCGSMTFWCGSGSEDPCLWLDGSGCGSGSFYFSSLTFKMSTKKLIKKKVFLHITFWRYFYIIYQR